MSDQLFQKQPVSDFAEEMLREAKAQADKLTLEQLEAPDISTTLEKIATFKFDVASLKPDQRKGKRRTEKQRRTDYGREIIIDVDFIDVAVPFEGWPRSFHLAPSSRRIIDDPAVIKNGALQVSFLDDQNLERNVDSFMESVTQNLKTLALEMQRIGPQMLQAARSVVDQRLQQLRERRARDKTRSFPIE